jgi:D-3-phosphoglycerate dehydrogenase
MPDGKPLTKVSIAPLPAAAGNLATIEMSDAELVPLEEAEVLVWQRNSVEGLAETLAAAPGVRWVQLTSAGVDWLLASGIDRPGVMWTCAKGSAMGENAAELAVAMILVASRELHTFLRAHQWLNEAGRRLSGSRVGILGGGGIGRAIAKMLQPFSVDVTVVKRTPGPIEGAQAVVGPESLDAAISSSDFFVLAAPLTESTRGVIDERRLDSFRPDAWLVNVARGGLVHTESLVRALQSSTLAGAALDVVEPEPLPEDHPLWDLPNVILTPHVASTRSMAPGAVAEVLADNLERWANGRPLAGVVDRALGY